ncbi:MAG: L-serine ammonia-lyase [Bryobacterales bacterium]|nr:L-serine ammonia-lyase [Bryobacterales bacterium]
MPGSVLDLFSIGVGPSSSHTLGPMRAARHFASGLETSGALRGCSRVCCMLYGSLALTGRGHCTDKAILAGLSGRCAEEIAPGELAAIEAEARASQELLLAGEHRCGFDMDADLQFRTGELLPAHSNGMRFQAFDDGGRNLAESIYYSVGGGFVVDGDGRPIDVEGGAGAAQYPYLSGEMLVSAARERGIRIADLVWEWERGLRGEEETMARLLRIAAVMDGCIDSGLHAEGHLPGGLGVRRRAPAMYQRLIEVASDPNVEPAGGEAMDWLSVYAIAVNEENAAMGRVVSAPTNGAAGIIPSVLRYYLRHMANFASDEARKRDTAEFLMVAGAIGILYKVGASLSAAEVGCQGEVGVACSMAAGALASVMGGTNAQVENAAEIGMEHNLGLTCDPIGGLVQIPCIERNSMGAVKAVNAARLALYSDGIHVVSLDSVIATMRRTGEDMSRRYKETSLGGLAVAVTVPEC